MQENNNTKKIIIISVVMVILLAVFAYILLSKNNNTAIAPVNTTENKPIFPNFSFDNIFGGGDEDVPSDTATEAVNLTASNVFKVWDGETLGAATLDDGSVLFVDKKAGEIRKSSFPYETTEVVDTISPGCFEAKVAQSGKKILVSCSDGLYVWGDSRFTFVDNTAFDYDFVGYSNDFVYMSGTATGFVLNQNKAGKVTTLGNMGLRDVTILKTDNDYVYIGEKPNGRSQNLFVYSFKNRDFYYVGDIFKQNIAPFQMGYVKEKCFTYDAEFNFCFGKFFDSFDFTSWRKGLISSNDEAFAYSFVNNEYLGVGRLSAVVDSIKVGHNATSGDAYMIDKNTSDLFVVNMAQFIEATQDEDH